MTNISNEKSSKLKNLNSSINKMLDFVKDLEKLRSYKYMSSLTKDELNDVLAQIRQIEESIEALNNPANKDSETGNRFKAIGKNRKLWVTRPDPPKKETSTTDTSRITCNNTTNPMFFKTQTSIRNIYETPKDQQTKATT